MSFYQICDILKREDIGKALDWTSVREKVISSNDASYFLVKVKRNARIS